MTTALKNKNVIQIIN
uniref:Uncharacterized protein n=1 Tax=Lepeophtheirus salmonis TaxID=72036 RepID=A0A0K2SXU6_LEPSM